MALGELPQEPEVDRSLGHHLGTVAVTPGQEEGRDVGHHARMHDHRLGRQLVDLIVRHPQVVEPFPGDLLAGALTHRLLDVVAGPVEAVRAVGVDHQLVLRRVPEVRVALDVPRQQPIGIAHGHQAAGDGAPVETERVALADPLDVGRNLVVEGDDACRLIAALVGVGTELVGPTEGGVLGGDVAPHRPDAALLDVPDPLGRGVVVPPRGVFDRRAVGNEDEVVLGDVASSALSALDPLDPASDLAFRGDVEHDVGDLRVVHNRDALLLEPLDEREDQRVVLVEASELDGAEIRHPTEVLDEAVHVELHLQGAVPGPDGEHRQPIHPEVAGEELLAHEFLEPPVE